MSNAVNDLPGKQTDITAARLQNPKLLRSRHGWEKKYQRARERQQGLRTASCGVDAMVEGTSTSHLHCHQHDANEHGGVCIEDANQNLNRQGVDNVDEIHPSRIETGNSSSSAEKAIGPVGERSALTTPSAQTQIEGVL